MLRAPNERDLHEASSTSIRRLTNDPRQISLPQFQIEAIDVGPTQGSSARYRSWLTCGSAEAYIKNAPVVVAWDSGLRTEMSTSAGYGQRTPMNDRGDRPILADTLWVNSAEEIGSI
jgi:hypothetical protein